MIRREVGLTWLINIERHDRRMRNDFSGERRSHSHKYHQYHGSRTSLPHHRLSSKRQDESIIDLVRCDPTRNWPILRIAQSNSNVTHRRA